MTVDYDRKLFGEIERFIKIEIDGVEYEIPDKLELLRVFQFLDFEIDYSRLCWNGSCNRCNVSFEGQGKSGKAALSCRLKSYEGMKVGKLPPSIRVPKGE